MPSPYAHLGTIGIACLLLLGYTEVAASHAELTAAPPSSATAPILVNREHPLDPGFAPSALADVEGIGLTPEAAADLTALLADARGSGVPVEAISGYRPYEEQAGLVESYTAAYGPVEASRISAPAGTSEHQTGLAVDIANPDRACALQSCFADTAAGAWAAANAWRHGFIVRYPADGEAVTGYAYEPWHLRWVGVKTAADMHDRGITVLEHYGR